MSLQEPKAVQLHRPTAAIKLPEAATWPLEDVMALYELPFNELMFRAQEAHRAHWPDGDVELATLLSIKTGGCEEDCGYCPQAARYDTGVEAKKILDLDTVLDAAKQAKDNGATRFCMGAAWRSPKERDMEKVETMVREVKAMGLETCATLGMLEAEQAQRLKDAGLDYYQDRLDTLGHVRNAGLKVCCGGIVGMGETREQRAGLIAQLANLNPYPESVPVNHLVQVEGTPLHGLDKLDPLEFVRTIAVARITMPKARVRLSAGRRELGEAVQAMCFMAGANSIFYGDKLLTTDNPEANDDRALLAKLGLPTRGAVLDSVQKEACGC
jgi:biotin synthase